MRGPGYLDQRKILNFFLLAQYLARIYRIHLSSKILGKSHGIWIKGLFNFFLYIFASHVSLFSLCYLFIFVLLKIEFQKVILLSVAFYYRYLEPFGISFRFNERHHVGIENAVTIV